ncbi:hypothetical protein BSK66_10100 [Paenibacillus odorifer]|uniref:Uncharacterized protein n=1 Tax=Paenibacillus odorifer TaxID=189426 RepID=A0A1R0XDS7_9BACL|nr:MULTISPECIES: hypothetical protein [Paenibacillus]ETT45426.1 hypothetical protein C171_32056 [Paenibacillus sp. FSL H8-237]OMD33212.1 hypothetical protein BJP51_12685 [Paenibacillus odorifer]OME59691.1 hypothetical protein BSK66_10100 [Paenibacillus odorifer]
MLKIVRSEICSKCSNNIFKLIKVDQYGNWIRCSKCRLQRCNKDIDIIFVSEYLEDEYILEQYDNEFEIVNFMERKEKARKRLTLLFNNNFLSSKHIWKNELSDLVSESEFNELSLNFVIKWFENQGWNKPDREQAQCIAEVCNDVQVIARAGSGKTARLLIVPHF